MRKLNLDSLAVETFDTTAAAPRQRGTVAAHADPHEDADALADYPGTTINPGACGPTNYLDCTYGCSLNTHCLRTCIQA